MGSILICGGIYTGIHQKPLKETYFKVKSQPVRKSNVERCSEIESEYKDSNWLCYESHKGAKLKDTHGQYVDGLIKRWTQGEFTDDELSEILIDYLGKQDIAITTAGILSGQRCLFETQADIPDYAQQLAASEGIYDFIGMYSNGKLDESGKQICYYWEARIQ